MINNMYVRFMFSASLFCIIFFSMVSCSSGNHVDILNIPDGASPESKSAPLSSPSNDDGPDDNGSDDDDSDYDEPLFPELDDEETKRPPETITESPS